MILIPMDAESKMPRESIDFTRAAHRHRPGNTHIYILFNPTLILYTRRNNRSRYRCLATAVSLPRPAHRPAKNLLVVAPLH
eukprot:174847-Prorocentrum_minimum.AAC.1